MLEHYLQSPAPQLRAFHAYFNCNMSAHGDSGDDIAGFIPELFDGHTPCLRDLSLNGIYVPLTSPIYTGLTSLALAYPHYALYPASRISDIIHVLAACPLLKKLRLSNIAFILGDDNPPPTSPLHMQRLKSLSLEDVDHGDVRFILASIRVSPALRIYVTMNAEPALPMYDILPGNVMDVFPNISTTRTMDVDFAEGAIGICCSARSGIKFKLTVTSRGGSDDRDRGACFSSLRSLGNLPNLTTFSLCFPDDNIRYSDTNVSSALFIENMERLSSIKSMSLIRCPASFIEALRITPTSHLCPRLKSLYVEKHNFDDVRLSAIVLSRTTEAPATRGQVKLERLSVRVYERLNELESRADLEQLPLSVDVEEDDPDEVDQDVSEYYEGSVDMGYSS
ncbi:hypothetical protein BOTBODRAFT_36795 [Botryobasidium botryosum FD-172 SS1]|uniref:F-box domain-containing protein n=1 Tax=Botryobasidium botryosum (strain FD-172 SS1) TaxID=930990 RepID=A0A067MDL8_BOTB1|nr:hypothetical protein BOTBODRAFT_36795 [Botryobasidium botryosum FD-172 SS1]